jgi:hypothetical protein
VLGFIGSGKGTCGDILESDFSFKKDAFANPLKDAVAAIFGWDRDLLEGDTAESRIWRETIDPWWEKRVPGMTPRYALQLMGTEAGRNIFDSDIWLYSMERRMFSGNNYVITDVRFPNEMSFIRSLGGKIVRVKRGPEPLWYDYAAEWNFKISKIKDANDYMFHNPQIMDKYPGIHYSEFAWVGHSMDYVIENEGTIEELKLKVFEMVDNYIGK